jgi:membrane-bound serine protease (ClpP class)
MNKKGEMSALKAWLIVLASLLDDAAVLVLIFLGLWFFHIAITWTIILAVALVIVVFFIIMHKAVVPSLRRRKVTGAEGMIGQTGKVIESLKPEGTIEIKGEYWTAKSMAGEIKAGDAVEVMEIDGLMLKVRRKAS